MRETMIDFTSYIAERARDFSGREWVFAEIDGWLADPRGEQFLIVTGEPGIGKTAIAARLTQFSAGDETRISFRSTTSPAFMSGRRDSFCSLPRGAASS